MSKYRRLFISVGALLFVLLISSLSGCGHRTIVKPKNVILIVVDALRFDHLSFYGYERKTTPVIDSLAENAAVYLRAYSQANWTCPSMASIFSGTYPVVHKVYNKPEEIKGTLNVIPDKLTLLTEWFQNQGFLTAGITALGWVSPQTNYKGFEEYLLADRDDEQIAYHAARFVSKEKNRPFFLYLHFLDMHDYFWPKYESGKFVEGAYNLSKTLKSLLNRKPGEILRKLKRLDKGEILNEEDLRYLEDRYDSLLFRTDELIGRIVARLEETHQLDDTLIIFTADHGERFYEHEEMGHGGSSLYSEVVHIPLILHNRKMFPSRRTFEKPVESIDIFPTLVDIFQAPPVVLEGIEQLNGSSLLRPKKDKVVMIENSVQDRVKIISGDWSYIYLAEKKEGELYYLPDDPFERQNRARTDLAVTRKMHGIFLNKMEKLRPLAERTGSQSASLDDKTREKLRALGYIK